MEMERDNRVRPCELPDASLLRQATAGAYWDCYTSRITGRVRLEEFVLAFYSCRAFWPERMLLSAVGFGCGLDDAAAMARGDADRYAAWSVEARGEGALLMLDAQGVTRSYFSVQQLAEGTELRFGSGVGTGTDRNSRLMTLMLPFHRWYSRVLLASARARLLRV